MPKTYEETIRELEAKLSLLTSLTGGAATLEDKVHVTNRLLVDVFQVLAEIKLSLSGVGKINPSETASQQKLVTSAGTAEQLPYVKIPFDHKVLIKALSTNAGIVYLGNSKTEAEDTSMRFPLGVSETVEYEINDLSQLWLDAATSADGITWTVVQ